MPYPKQHSQDQGLVGALNPSLLLWDALRMTEAEAGDQHGLTKIRSTMDRWLGGVVC